MGGGTGHSGDLELKLAGGEGGANGAKIGVFWRVCDANDARFFLADDASDAHVFGKEPLPIVGENVIKTCIIWRAGDANDASI